MSKYRDTYLLNYINKRVIHAPSFRQHIKSLYFRRFMICLLLYPLPNVGLFIKDKIQKSTKQKIAIFEPAKKLIEINPDKYELITIGRPSWEGYFSIHRLQIYLFLYLYVSKSFVKIYRKEIKNLRRLFRDVDYLILQSDGLPLARAILSATYGLETKSVCVQHGVFWNSLADELDGSKCDINVIQNRSQKLIFDESQVCVDLVYSEVCDHSTKLKNEKKQMINPVAVLIGQGFHTENINLHEELLKNYKKITQQLRNRGWRVFYRPHPIEWKNIPTLLNIIFQLKCIPTKKLRHEYTYIGSTSTILFTLYFDNYNVFRTPNSAPSIIPELKIPDLKTTTDSLAEYSPEEVKEFLLEYYVPNKYSWDVIHDAIR